MPGDKLYGRLSVLLFLTLILVVLFTFTVYGASWDEEAQHLYGNAVFRFYASFGADRSADTIGDNLKYYGGFFELLSYIATRVSPFGVFETRHLLSALCGIAGILACWKLARLLAGTGAAFWTALLLALYPSYYGHMFINSKDIPFAALYMWSLYYLVRALHEFPEVSIGAAARFGIASGLAMGVRVGGLLLLCYLYLFTLLCLVQPRLKGEAMSRTTFWKILKCWSIATVVAYAIMLAFWPYALIKPLQRPFTSLAFFSHFNNEASPRDWVVRHLLFKLPEHDLVLLLIALILGIGALLSGRLKIFRTTVPYLVLIVAVAFPVIYAAAVQAYFYDEVRHFLFIVPPLFCLLGITCSRVVNRILRNRIGVAAIATLAAVTLFFHLRLMLELHPYEYAYYNHLIGGVYGAHQRGYETEYWATSYKEAVARLKDYLRERDGGQTQQYKILVRQPEFAAAYYFPTNFHKVMDPAEAEFLLSTTRYGIDSHHPEVVRVSRAGVAFTVVQDLNEKDER